MSMPESVSVKAPSSRTRLLQTATNELTKNANTDEGLRLADLNITSIPPELIELIKDSVTKLSLQKNVLTQLPNYFNRLSNLRYLDLHQNKFTEFPAVLCSFNRLEILDVSENYIKKLPLNIGKLVNLKVLSLKDNKFEYLPSSIGEMANLKILEISDNPLLQPSTSLITELQNGPGDWLEKLKAYIREHGKYLDSKIQESHEFKLERSRSNSTDYLSTKAAKRMGFIVNKKPFSSVSSLEEGESPISSPPQQAPPPVSQSAPTAASHVPTHQSPQQQQQIAPPSAEAPAPPPSESAHQPQQTVNGTTLLQTPVPKEQQTPEAHHTPTPKPSHYHSLSQPDLMKQLISPPIQPGSTNARARSQTAVGRNETKSNSEMPSLAPAMEDLKEEHDAKNTSYFKRLSTLQEIKTPKDIVIIGISKKLLFIYTSLHNNLGKLTSFCQNRIISMRMTSSLSSAKDMIVLFSNVLQTFETTEKDKAELIDQLLHCIVNSLDLYKQMMRYTQENLAEILGNAELPFIRSLYLTIYSSFIELFNACKILYPDLASHDDNKRRVLPQETSHAHPALRIDTGLAQAQPQDVQVVQSAQTTSSQVSDERLLESVYNATSAAQIVFSQLTNAINKTALSNVPLSSSSEQPTAHTSASNEIITSKVKDLTSICVSAIESTKSLKNSLHVVSTSIPQQQDKLRFYKDTNMFLKSVINILNTTKASINDLPVLNELRPSLAALTKATKDVTIMLENSTFKTIYISQQQYSTAHEDHIPPVQPPPSAIASHPPPLSSIPSMAAFPPFHAQQPLLTQQQQLSNIQASLPPVTTPLIAAIGSAQSQALLPNGNDLTSPQNQQQMQQNPFDTFFANNTSQADER